MKRGYQQMKKGPSHQLWRGDLIDKAAVKKSLEENILAGLGLDVTQQNQKQTRNLSKPVFQNMENAF